MPPIHLDSAWSFMWFNAQITRPSDTQLEPQGTHHHPTIQRACNECHATMHRPLGSKTVSKSWQLRAVTTSNHLTPLTFHKSHANNVDLDCFFGPPKHDFEIVRLSKSNKALQDVSGAHHVVQHPFQGPWLIDPRSGGCCMTVRWLAGWWLLFVYTKHPPCS